MDSTLTRTLSSLSHLACLIDGSPGGGVAAELGRRFAPVGARLSLVHVDDTPCCPLVSPMGDVWLLDPDAVRAAAEEALSRAVALRPEAAGVLLRGDRAPELCRWAREARADLLLVPYSRPGRLRRALRGDPLAFLDRHSPCAVVAVEASGEWAWRVRTEDGEAPAPAAVLDGVSCPA